MIFGSQTRSYLFYSPGQQQTKGSVNGLHTSIHNFEWTKRPKSASYDEILSLYTNLKALAFVLSSFSTVITDLTTVRKVNKVK